MKNDTRDGSIFKVLKSLYPIICISDKKFVSFLLSFLRALLPIILT